VTTLELPVPAVPAPRAARAPHRRGHAGSAPIRVVVSGRALVLVAGMPGAGKSTLLAGLRRDPGTVVLDSDDHRVALARRFPRLPYRRYRALVHLRHRAAVVRAAFSDASTVVVHLPATSTVLRSAVALVAATTGRTAHLLWLHVDPAEALRGQRDRGRLIPSASFAGPSAGPRPPPPPSARAARSAGGRSPSRIARQPGRDWCWTPPFRSRQARRLRTYPPFQAEGHRLTTTAK